MTKLETVLNLGETSVNMGHGYEAFYLAIYAALAHNKKCTIFGGVLVHSV